MAAPGVEVTGLVDLVRVLKGPAFRNINAELREYAPRIAEEAVPHVRLAVSMSRAPQARAMANTIRVKRDRVPVIAIGKVNPKLGKRFTRPGSNSQRRRGAIAHGVVYGPKGGHPGHGGAENFYRIPRDDSGGRLGRTLREGPAVQAVTEAYLKYFQEALTRHGFADMGGDKIGWRG